MKTIERALVGLLLAASIPLSAASSSEVRMIPETQIHGLAVVVLADGGLAVVEAVLVVLPVSGCECANPAPITQIAALPSPSELAATAPELFAPTPETELTAALNTTVQRTNELGLSASLPQITRGKDGTLNLLQSRIAGANAATTNGGLAPRAPIVVLVG